MNLDEIKQLANGGEKLVFIENGKVAGVFLSYEEYRKINGKKEEKTTSALPLSSQDYPNENDGKVISEPPPLAAQEPEAIIDGLSAGPVSEPVKLEADLTTTRSEKELTVDDLPF